jgi:hypothetical protein
VTLLQGLGFAFLVAIAGGLTYADIRRGTAIKPDPENKPQSAYGP